MSRPVAIEGARSVSHRWLVEPDRIADGAVVRGHIVRMRLDSPVKPGWRAARWDELDANYPPDREALRWKAERDACAPIATSVKLTAYQDGVPFPVPVSVSSIAVAETPATHESKKPKKTEVTGG